MWGEGGRESVYLILCALCSCICGFLHIDACVCVLACVRVCVCVCVCTCVGKNSLDLIPSSAWMCMLYSVAQYSDTEERGC